MYYIIYKANSNGPDQTEQMGRLVCAFVVRMQQSQVFSHQGQNIGTDMPDETVYTQEQSELGLYCLHIYIYSLGP